MMSISITTYKWLKIFVLIFFYVFGTHKGYFVDIILFVIQKSVSPVLFPISHTLQHFFFISDLKYVLLKIQNNNIINKD